MGEEQIKLIADYYKDLAAAWVVTGFITPVVEHGFDRARPFSPLAGALWIVMSLYYLAMALVLLISVK